MSPGFHCRSQCIDTIIPRLVSSALCPAQFHQSSVVRANAGSAPDFALYCPPDCQLGYVAPVYYTSATSHHMSSVQNSHDTAPELAVKQTAAKCDLSSSETRQQHASVPAIETVGAHECRQVLRPSGSTRRLRGSARVVWWLVERSGRRCLH